MCQMRRLLVTLLLGLLAACLLLGCRFWEPETVIVNKPPKIYIIGAPAETSGAYFHFHVFWYGTDEDGYVERYVWALTDTSVQDRRTIQDQEDQRFNPHLDITHLEIGNWTTRTDTIFDFRIGQGSSVQRDMTLHMVAVDDQGAFSHRPARLHFFSNALGTPRLQFFRVVDENSEVDANSVEFGDGDFLGYGRPLHLRWTGTTPNIARYDTDALGDVDTVGVVDGLLGFKWRLPQLDGCNPSVEDCWQPRRFNEATGDSLSYFADLGGLTFWNDGEPGFFRRRLNAGNLQLLVNAIDVAGVEVRPERRLLNIQVNYPPAAHIVGAPNPPADLQRLETDHLPQDFWNEYPYFIVFHGPESRPDHTRPVGPDNPYTRHPLTTSPGDSIPRIPDGAYVVFMALGWEQSYLENQVRTPYDELNVFPDKPPMQFQGQFIATGIRRTGRRITYRTDRSPLQINPDFPEWTAEAEEVAVKASADTLGFLVGPFHYRVLMRAADEHETRSAPASYSFAAGFPPCIQGVEVANNHATTVPLIGVDLSSFPCIDEPGPINDGSPDILEIRGDLDPSGDANERFRLVRAREDAIFVNPSAGLVRFEQPQTGTWMQIPGFRYYYRVFLHGRDGIEPDGRSREYWPPGEPHRRIAAWRYQIDYEGDVDDAIKDGGGRDDIRDISGFDVTTVPPAGIRILAMGASDDPDNPSYRHYRGAWELLVTVSVPQVLLQHGAQAYWDTVQARASSISDAREIYRLTTMQLSPGRIRAVALDQSFTHFRQQSNCYNIYYETRTPEAAHNFPHRRCTGAGSGAQPPIDLSLFAQQSKHSDEHDLYHTRYFEIHLYHSNGDRFEHALVPPGQSGSSGRGVPGRRISGLWR